MKIRQWSLYKRIKMKRMILKRIFLLAIGCMLFGTAKAQHQALFDEYLREVGDRSELFIGKMEPGYSSAAYKNHPYWFEEDFLRGEVMYKGLLYRDVLLRYDVFLQQLVVKTPVKQSNVNVPMLEVESFTMGETAFTAHEGEFMAVLYDGSRVRLLERMRINLKEDTEQTKVQYEFKRQMNFFVLHDGKMTEVGKMRSVLKQFPELEKELKRYAKMNRLNFRENRKSSLMSILKYVDELLVNP